MHTVIITGGAGFIGSHVLRCFVQRYPHYRVVNADSLTYAGNLENLADLADSENYFFERVDIRDAAAVKDLFDRYQPDGVVHLAAESHVDRSIADPMAFVETNVIGTVNLLNAARTAWAGAMEGKRFYHISTDEVFGALGAEGLFTEETPYSPNSPYSASKASSDHFVRAYHETYGLPVVLSNCSNNYGPYQNFEKLIPKTIFNLLNNRKVPIYSNGSNIRDWIFVEDHCEILFQILKSDYIGNLCIGGDAEESNLQIVEKICKCLNKQLNENIEYVKDRPGHDFRYAIDNSKIYKMFDWTPKTSLE